MTKDEYDNWCDFALRMAWNVYGDRDNFEWIVEHVEDFLGNLDTPEMHWVDGSPMLYADIESWESSKNGALPICDDMANIEAEEQPRWIEMLSDAVEQGDVDDELVKDAQALIERWEQRWIAPVSNCIRAGLDMAMQIGGGVVGFELGDVRRMYPEGIPAFVRRHYDHDLDTLPPDQQIWL